MDTQEIAKIIAAIKNGGVGVIPTDTLYGLVGSALNEEAVERIYVIRKRESSKPMIVLISSLEDLDLFDISLDQKSTEKIASLWPGKVSIVLDCPPEKFTYLHRGGATLAFRYPADEWLLELLGKTGPLVAPSANIAGAEPARSIEDAKSQFDGKVDFYLDAGTLESRPSTLVRVQEGRLSVLRDGEVKIALK